MKEASKPGNHYLAYAKDGSIIAVSQVIISLFLFLRLPILTKWMGASLFGTWSIIWVTIVLATSFVTLGLNSAVVRFLAAEKDDAKIRQGYFSAVVAVFGVGLICCLILVTCSDFFANSIFGNQKFSLFIKVSSVMIITQSINQMSIAFFRTFRQIKRYSLLLIGKATTELLFMILFLYLGWELVGIILGVLISDFLCISVSLYFIARLVGIQWPRFNDLGNYLKYGLPLVPSSAILWITNFSDRYIIGYFMDAKAVGIYTAAYTLANIVSMFMGPLQVILLPTISKSYYEGDIAETKVYLSYSWKYILVLAIPTVFGLSVLSTSLLSILTTPEFISGNIVIPLIATGILFYCLNQVCVNILYLLNKTSLILIILGIATVLNIGLNCLLIPFIGILGAGIANLLTKVSLAIISVIISFRYLKFDLNEYFIVKNIIASSLMALFIWLLGPSNQIQIIFSILLGMILYAVILIVLKGINKNEIRLLKNIVLG